MSEIRTLDRLVYEREFAPVHDAVISGRPPDAKLFCDPTWPMVLLTGGLRMLRRDFQALAHLAAGLEEDCFVVADGLGEFADEPPNSFRGASNRCVRWPTQPCLAIRRSICSVDREDGELWHLTICSRFWGPRNLPTTLRHSPIEFSEHLLPVGSADINNSLT